MYYLIAMCWCYIDIFFFLFILNDNCWNTSLNVWESKWKSAENKYANFILFAHRWQICHCFFFFFFFFLFFFLWNIWMSTANTYLSRLDIFILTLCGPNRLLYVLCERELFDGAHKLSPVFFSDRISDRNIRALDQVYTMSVW